MTLKEEHLSLLKLVNLVPMVLHHKVEILAISRQAKW